MRKPLVVNLKSGLDYDVFVGRPGPFGNPFRIGRDGNRQDVIRKYRGWFLEKVVKDDEFLRAVLALSGKILGCYCKPLGCHGDVIAEFLELYEELEKAAHE